ncbi:unnamed protein product [Leptidea sinapis]|uniref:Uncharacterized protein n=1 Tax=Leptidea sinapis TaxID=189913 RepID=A0A5E4QF63_9NEOP|nr:unnamed protein product [Leptidea sinapis]
MLRLIYLFGFVISARCASAPFITPCKSGDQTCLITSARAALPHLVPGVPELGIKSMDPMHIDTIESNQGDLKLHFKDTTMTGIRGCSIDSIKHDLNKMKQSISLKCNMELVGEYLLSGQLLILPVQGQGKYKIDIRDIVIKVATDLKSEAGEDGKQHWRITKWKDSFKVLTGATFQFDNLFNGNKLLGDPVLQFVNSNWKDVMQEIAPPIVHAVLAEIIEAVQALYAAVPAEELYVQ